MRRGLQIAARIFLGLILFLTLVAAALHLALTTTRAQQYLRSRLEATLSRRLQRDVQIGKIKLSPVLNFLEFREVAVRGPETAPLFQVGSVRFYPDLGSLLRGVLAFRTVVILHPVIEFPGRLMVREGRRGEWNLPPLLALFKAQSLLAVQVDRLQIREGEWTYRGQGLTWSVQGLDADLWPEGARVLGEVRVTEGTLHLPTRSVAWRNAEALVVLTEQDLVVTRLGIDVGEGSLGLTGRITDPFGDRTLELRLTAGLPVTLPTAVPGSIRVEGQLTGSALNPHFHGSARIEGAKVPECTVEISADREGLRGEHVMLLAVPGDVSGGFYLRWKDWSYSAEFRGRGLDLVPLATPMLGRLPVTGVVDAEAAVKGRGLTAKGLTAHVAFQVSSLMRHDEPGIVGRAVGVVKAEGGRFTLQRLRVDLPPNHLTLKGPLGKGLTLHVSGNFPRVNTLGRFLGAKGLGGKGRVVGQVTGPVMAPTFQGTLTWDAPRLLGIDLRRVRGKVLVEKRRLTAPRLIVTRGKSTGTFRLRLTLPEKEGAFVLKQNLRIEAEGQVKGVPRDVLSLFVRREVPLTGRLTLDAALAGTASRLEGRGHFIVKNPVLFGEPWQVMKGDLELQPDRLLFKQVRLARGAEQVTGNGLLHLKDLETTLRVATPGLSLEGFPLFARRDLRGHVQAEVLVEGRIDNPRIRGDYEIKDLRHGPVHLGSGRGSFLVQDREMTAQLALPERGYFARGMLGATPPYSYDVEVTMERADLALLFALTGVGLLEGGTGTGSGRAQLVGHLTADRPTGLTLELEAPRLVLDRKTFRTVEPFRLEMSRDTLTISSFAVTGKEGWLNVRGEIAFHGKVDFDVQGKIPLALVLRRRGTVAGVTGNGHLDLNVSGLWKAPRYVGWFRVERGGLRFTHHPEALEPIEGWVKFQGRKIQIPSLEGRWAGGKVKVSGKATRGKKRRWRWVLDVVLDEADGKRVFAKGKGVQAPVTGWTSLWGKVTATGSHWGELKQSLGGKLNLVLLKGRVRRFTVLANILRLLNLAPDPVEGVPYDRLKAVFDLKQGVAETRDLKFVSDTIKVGGVGKIDLVGGEVDMLLGVQPLRTLDKVINFLQLSKIPLLGRLLFGKEGSVLVVAVKVRGPLANPQVVAVPKESLGRGVFGVLRRLLELPAQLFPGGKSGTPP